MRHATEKLFKKVLGMAVLSVGFLIGFSGLSVQNAKTMLFHSMQDSVEVENQQIRDSLIALRVPKAQADTTGSGGSGGSGSDDDGCSGCGCGCCGCGGGE